MTHKPSTPQPPQNTYWEIARMMKRIQEDMQRESRSAEYDAALQRAYTALQILRSFY